MRRLILTIFFMLIAVLLVWTVFSVFKKSGVSQEPQTQQAPSAEVQPQVTEPPPNSVEALIADTLNEALLDIDALE